MNSTERKLKQKYIGQKNLNYQGDEMEVLDIITAKKAYIKFKTRDYSVWTAIRNFKDGKIKNPFYPSVEGVGYTGNINFPRKYIEYDKWRAILIRCYNKKFLEQYSEYEGSTICEEWHSLENFIKDYKKILGYRDGVNLSIDKDILGDEKLYSLKTCCLVTHKTNSFLASIYHKCDNPNLNLGVSIQTDSEGHMNYYICMSKNGKNVNLGTFKYDTNGFEEASKTYWNAKYQHAKELTLLESIEIVNLVRDKIIRMAAKSNIIIEREVLS